MASNEEGFTGNDFNLKMVIGEYQHPIAYSELSNIKASPETLEAFRIWDYWTGK